MINIVAQTLATIAFCFWPVCAVVSIMALGAPNADNDLETLKSIRLILFYPVVIAILFFVFKSRYLGVSGGYLVIILLVICTVGTNFLGLNAKISNLKKGILNSGYCVVDEIAYFNAIAIEGVDLSSFHVFSKDELSRHWSYLAKDKYRLYRWGNPVADVDPNTLEFLNYQDGRVSDSYFKDHNYVFYLYKILPDADPATFSLINTQGSFLMDSVLARDKNTLWYKDQAIKDINPDSFQNILFEDSLTSYFSAQSRINENRQYYWQGQHFYTSASAVTKAINYESIIIDDSLFIQNKKYFSGKDVHSIRLVSDKFYKTSKDVYLAQKNEGFIKIEGADPSTFEDLKIGYAKDKDTVYFYHNEGEDVPFHIIKVADAESFEIVMSTPEGVVRHDAKDNNHYYMEGYALD